MKTKDMPKSERPYEKAEKYGISSLSDAELLSVIIRTGTKEVSCMELAAGILGLSEHFKGLNVLNHIEQAELKRIPGIGKVKAIQLLSIAELSRRMNRLSLGERPVFTDPDTAAAYFMSYMRHLETEELRCAFLDTKFRLIGFETVFSGSVNKSMLEPREILVRALRKDAVSFILVHNHPSGDPTPSEADRTATRRVKEAALIVGLSLIDHIVIGDNRYVSLKEAGMI